MRQIKRTLVVCAVTSILSVIFVGKASATLTFYYDPDTGNVSFDTSQTRTGKLYSYGLSINPYLSSLEFRIENQVRLSLTTAYTNKPQELSDNSIGTPLEGVYTVGDILPAGLSQELWSQLFIGRFRSVPSATDPYLGGHSFVDAIGQGYPPEPAEFVYGAPDAEFNNRWDLVDPDTLPWAEQATLLYDPLSGNVKIDTTGIHSGYIASFLLTTDQAFHNEQYTPFLDVPIVTSFENSIGLVADAIEPGVYNLGAILNPGLSESDLEDFFTAARFLGRAGFKGRSFEFQEDGIAFQYALLPSSAVPEVPSLLHLCVLALCVFRLSRR